MWEEVVALQHRWPLPQQHQLSAWASRMGKSVQGIVLSLSVPSCHSERPQKQQHLGQVGMKGALSWTFCSPCTGHWQRQQ